MEFEKRAMCSEEDKYTFRQSTQISSQCGLIGHLRADFDNGTAFFSEWFDYRSDLKTNEFKTEFDNVINSLREEGDILHDLKSLAKYCRDNPQAKMSANKLYYGVRVDTEKYAYLFRLNPNAGDYNVSCYCYMKHWLDAHIRNARNGIRFIDSGYQELFRIPDGGKIHVTYSDGSEEFPVCRYIDAYHVEIGDNLYHICEYAELRERCGASIKPVKEEK